MFTRLAFQSMHLKFSSFPITQLMNRNNAIPHKRESLSFREGLSGCSDGLWPIQDSLMCDLSPLEVPLSRRYEFFLRPTNFHQREGIINHQQKFQTSKVTLEVA